MQILENISFSVESGEVLEILGPNGVGKTTLLRCMMGLLPWISGQSTLDGKSLREIPVKQLWSRISYVPQAKGLSFSYSALEMVLLGRSAHLRTLKQPQKDDFAIAEQAMQEVGIAHLKDKLCSKMSGGELQMLLIARALTTQGAEEWEETEFAPMFESCKPKLSGKKIVLFGSYDWGDGEWMRAWEETCRTDGAILACDSVICHETPDANADAACITLGKALV